MLFADWKKLKIIKLSVVQQVFGTYVHGFLLGSSGHVFVHLNIIVLSARKA